jgi:ribonuclease PH
VLTVKPRGAAARTLKRKGTAKVKATVRFTPTGGTARTRATTVKLIKRR